MADKKVHFIVDLAINEGKLGEFEATVLSMLAGTQNEAGTLSYDWFLSRDRKECRLLETYVDADAAAAHMNGPVVQVLVPKLLESARLTSFKVYGDPGPKGSEILAKVGAEILPAWHAISR